MSIRVEALGGVRILQDGEDGKPRELHDLPGQPRRCALLTYLAVEREVPRERIAGLLWPDSDPDQGRHNLSQTLYELRRDVGGEALISRPQRLEAAPALSSDVVDFVTAARAGQAQKAVHLYGGPFLDGVRLGKLPHSFEEWIDRTRSQCQLLFRTVQERQLRELDESGDTGGALAAVRRWAMADPWADEAHHALMERLAWNGLRHEAIHHYDLYRRRIEADLGLSPPEEMQRLAEALRAGSFSVADQAGNEEPASEKQSSLGVVVLPFLDISSDGRNGHLCNGIAEEVISQLGQVDDLRVISRTTAFIRRGSNPSIRTVARDLGVTHAIEGSVQTEGDDFRVKVRLVDTRLDGALAWEGRFSGSIAAQDLFELQEEVANGVLTALGAPVPRGESRPSDGARPKSEDGSPLRSDAYLAYLRGRHAWFQRTRAGFESAREAFDECLRLEPGYARAHAAMADLYNLLGAFDYALLAPDQAYPKALEHARRALELDPGLGQAHAALGNAELAYQWDPGAARRSFERAIELSPGYSPARQWFSTLLIVQGEEDRALAEAYRALELDPWSPYLCANLGRIYQFMGAPERAAEHFRLALEITPSFLPARLGLALSELLSNRPEQALYTLDEAQAQTASPFDLLKALRGCALAAIGETSEAQSICLELKATSKGYLSAEYVAAVYVALGEHERALTWLEVARDHHSQVISLLAVEPLFKPLRDQARFEALLEPWKDEDQAGITLANARIRRS